MPATLIWPRRSLGSLCQTRTMAALLISLFFVFTISFLPKYRVIYYYYKVVQWQARIQLLAKGEVAKIMENNVWLPQAANVSDRMPRKRVPQPARMSFSGYTICSECTRWEPTGGICKPASWSEDPGSNIMASKRAKLRGLLS